MRTRTAKQCRERWCQQLSPEFTTGPIDELELKLINDMVAAKGKQWALISRLLGNRSPNTIKNAWHSARRRKSHTRPLTATKLLGYQTKDHAWVNQVLERSALLSPTRSSKEIEEMTQHTHSTSQRTEESLIRSRSTVNAAPRRLSVPNIRQGDGASFAESSTRPEWSLFGDTQIPRVSTLSSAISTSQCAWSPTIDSSASIAGTTMVSGSPPKSEMTSVASRAIDPQSEHSPWFDLVDHDAQSCPSSPRTIDSDTGPRTPTAPYDTFTYESANSLDVPYHPYPAHMAHDESRRLDAALWSSPMIAF
ncbi:Myb-like DNA-binding domain-containing protein 4 [Elsinoe fawcettii]|nr:Myb-like DNA-binding domain-containing protein 4 [Elsinoe fawcettii]